MFDARRRGYDVLFSGAVYHARTAGTRRVISTHICYTKMNTSNVLEEDSMKQETQPQPSVPSQPPAPVQAGQSGGVPPKKSNKMLFLIIGIVGAVLLAGIILAVVMIFSMVSKADYRKATMQMNELASTTSDMNRSINSIQNRLSSSDDARFSQSLEEAKTAIEEAKQQSRAMAKNKAVRSGEGKEKYAAFDKKMQERLKFADEVTSSFGKLREATIACTGRTASDPEEAKAMLNKCNDVLAKSGDVPSGEVKEYMKALNTETEKLLSLITRMGAITDPYGAQNEEYRTVRDGVLDAQEKLRNIDTEFRNQFNKRLTDTNPQQAARDLQMFLRDKS